MKEIKAYIKKHKLEEVIRALRRIEGLTGMSVIDSCGFGVGCIFLNQQNLWQPPAVEGEFLVSSFVDK